MIAPVARVCVRARRLALILLVILQAYAMYAMGFDLASVSRGVQRLTEVRDACVSTNSTSSYFSRTAEMKRAAPSDVRQTVAIIVVTDASAASASWIVARLAHFDCYAKAQKYDFVHHVIDMGLYSDASFYTARWEAIVDNYWGKYDWIFAHDTDSLYPDFSINLQKFVESDDAADVQALARGTEIGANALLFRARNSDFAEAFMRRLISLGHRIPRPSAHTNYDVRDIMMVVLELIHPELAQLCEPIDDFFEFARCFTPAIERIPQLPSSAVPMKIHLPMSGFVQQFEAPASEYGILVGACWPGHVLLSGNGVKEHAPYPIDHGHACARDSTMNVPCVWLSHDDQLKAASECCLLQASVCDQRTHSCAYVESISDAHAISGNLSCKVGWPVLWAGGGEVIDRSVPQCGPPYIALKRQGIGWDNSAYLQTYSARLAVR